MVADLKILNLAFRPLSDEDDASVEDTDDDIEKDGADGDDLSEDDDEKPGADTGEV